MKPLIGVAIACALTLAVMPVPATGLNLDQAPQPPSVIVPPPLNPSSTTIVTPSASTTPPSASAYAPGHGATPPGQGGTPPGQAKPAEPDLDEADATGVFGNDILAFN